MKSNVALAVAAIMFAGGTAYAMQGMSCCGENCSCCNEKGGDHAGRHPQHPAPFPQPNQ